MAKGVGYTETNSTTVENEEYAGTTKTFTVVSLSKKFEGATEQEKIDAALASGLGSAPSTPVSVTFPMKPPAKPTGLKNENTAYNKTDLTWTSTPDAQSYTITQDGKVIKYLETNKITLTDEAFAGKTIKFSVTAYPRKYTGKDEQEKINNAVNSKEGSPKSDYLSVVFPAKPPEKPGTPTNLASHGTTFNHTTLDWTKPTGAKSFVLYEEDKPKAYTETDSVEVTNDSYASKTINFKVQAFNEVYDGKSDDEKMNAAVAGKKGGDFSEPHAVEFPAKEDSMQKFNKTVKK